MKNFVKKLLGLDKIEESMAEAQKIRQEAEVMLEAAKEQERISKLSPKELATERKESWVGVLDTKINKENVRTGFFELDWNEYFIVDLKLAGYTGDTDEEVVDKWFQDLCRNIGAEEGIDMERRGSGFINVNRINDNQSEIS